MRISDWSSDVCSSDLRALIGAAVEAVGIDARVGHAFPHPHPDPLDVGQQVEAIGAVDQRRHRGRAELRVALYGAEMKDLVAYRRQPLRGQDLREQLGQPRSEERRVGKEWVSPCRERGA